MNESDNSSAIAVAAGAWLARRDRGFTPTEQDAFLQWLSDDPRHRAAFARLDRAWTALDTLAEWQPAHSARPNPDLLAPGRSRAVRRIRKGAMAAGVALVCAAALAFFLGQAARFQGEYLGSMQGLRVIPRPEARVLPDGSILELKHGGRFTVDFTVAERRINLVEGELHVSVAKNAARPFIVEVEGVAVRAVGTAFNVRRGRGAVDVLVTEGRVQVESPAAAMPVSQGERARVDTVNAAARPVVSAATQAEIERELAWQGVMLEFEALPLAAVVAEFNVRNAQQLVLGDVSTGQVRVAGTFRADRVEAFVRMLEASFGIVVERRTEGAWVLRRAG